jgi:hypothetical protein
MRSAAQHPLQGGRRKDNRQRKAVQLPLFPLLRYHSICTAPNAVRCTPALAGGARECPVAPTVDWFNGSMGIPVMDPAIHGF